MNRWGFVGASMSMHQEEQKEKRQRTNEEQFSV